MANASYADQRERFVSHLRHLLGWKQPLESVPAHNIATVSPGVSRVKPARISRALTQIMQMIISEERVHANAVARRRNHDPRMRGAIDLIPCNHIAAATPRNPGADSAADPRIIVDAVG